MVLVLTFATGWTPTYQNFYASCVKQGYEVRVVGWKQPWRGWIHRMRVYAAWAAITARDNPTQLLVVCDAYDVLALRSAAEFEAVADKLRGGAEGDKLVVGAEWWCGKKSVCGHVPKWWAAQGLVPPKRQYANAGFVVGTAQKVADAYAWMVRLAEQSPDATDDQYLLARYIESAPQGVVLDVNSVLVANVHVMDGRAWVGGLQSFFAHFPGPMLKRGLFPHYNRMAVGALGKVAVPQYPSMMTDSVAFLLTLLALLVLYRSFLRMHT